MVDIYLYLFPYIISLPCLSLLWIECTRKFRSLDHRNNCKALTLKLFYNTKRRCRFLVKQCIKKAWKKLHTLQGGGGNFWRRGSESSGNVFIGQFKPVQSFNIFTKIFLKRLNLRMKQIYNHISWRPFWNSNDSTEDAIFKLHQDSRAIVA